MAQLIKLIDYISRYETNPFHYPTQYIRLKQENWRQVYERWEKELEKEVETSTAQDKDETKKRFFGWNPFQFKTEQTDIEKEVHHLPRTKQQVMQLFLNELYPFQLKWATSTLTQISYTDQKFNNDRTLKQFLQRLPDIYLLMYYPIFNIKNAPIDGDIILISPIGIDIIHIIKGTSNTIFASNERTWTIEKNNNSSKIISPLLSLKRTEQIVKSILNKHKIDFSINKTVLAKHSSIFFTNEPYQTTLIVRSEYTTWLEGKRQLSSPLKNVQLKAMEALLMYCQSTSVQRPEWEKDDDYMTPATFKEEE